MPEEQREFGVSVSVSEGWVWLVVLLVYAQLTVGHCRRDLAAF